MQTDLREAKVTLRKQIRGALHQISLAARATQSAQLRDRLKEQAIWKNAGSILFFAPLPEELDLWPLLEEELAVGKTIALPGFNPAGQSYIARQVRNLQHDIALGKFGIREPAAGCLETPMDRLDLILVPGVAFDRSGRRLGRGQGFYDRLLMNTGGVKCGIAFDEQLVDDVPAEPHDAKVDFILTPTRLVEIAG